MKATHSTPLSVPGTYSQTEALARRDQVRQYAVDNGLDGVLVHSWRRNLLTGLTGYFPGYVTNSASLWISADGPDVIGVRFPFEVSVARQRSGLPARHAVTPEVLLPTGAKHVGLLFGDSAVDETSAAFDRVLQERRLHSLNMAPWFDELREIKTPGELLGLRRAANVGSAALQAAATAAGTGRTDYEIVAAVEAQARANGAARADCLIGFGAGTVVSEACGHQLQPGEEIGLELNMQYNGYFSHVQTTVLPRNPAPFQVKSVDVVHEARNAVITQLVPGTAVADAVAAGDEVLNKHGLLGKKEYDFGHGIGWDTPEHPRLLSSSTRVIREGAVIAVHCSVRRPGGETAYTGGPVHIERSGAVELAVDPVGIIQGDY